MEYTLRKLKSEDIFKMSAIIKKVGVDEVRSALSSDEIKSALASGDAASMKGAGLSFVTNIAFLLIGNIDKAEKEIYSFASDVSGVDEKTLRSASPAEFMEVIVGIVKKDEFADFFGVVFKLFS